MTGRDPFEQQLQRAMAPRSAPTALQRRIARIPVEHPRPAAAAPFWRRWLDAVSAPWVASMSAALASLAIGFWLGFNGVVEPTGAPTAGAEEDLVALAFPSMPATMGEVE